MIASGSETLMTNLQGAAHELVRRNTSRGGDTQEDIARALGIERGRLSQILNAPGTPIPLHLAVQLHRVLRDDYLTQAICEACGGAFIAHEPEALSPGAAREAFSHAMDLLGEGMRESGEAMAVSAEVIRDRVATAAEKARVRREILQTISALGQLLQAISAMPERSAAPFGAGAGERF